MAENNTTGQLVSPEGSVVTASPTDLDTLKAIGYREQSPQELQQQAKEEYYSSTPQQILTGMEGAAEGALGPIGTAGALALGAQPEDMEARAEANPSLHTATKIGGFLGSALVGEGIAPALSEAAHAVPVIGHSLMGRLAAESALLQGGDEVSKMLMNDPQQSVGSAAINIGTAGLFGLGLGATGEHIISPLWKATVGDKVGQMMTDFGSRLNYHLNNPDPASALQSELADHYNSITKAANEVYGPEGLKAQDIAKAVPQELTPKITEQVQNFSNTLNQQLDAMVAKPYDYTPRLTQKFQADVANFNKAISEAKVPADYFTAIQDIKQTAQEYSSFGKFLKPTDDAYAFARDAKGLASGLKEGLEDSEVWGQAGKRQQAINKAFTEYLPSLKDFNKRFTVEIGGERVIDPGKVSTYINQLGKPNAEVKQEMLSNFLKASEKYSNEISKIHSNLGLSNPIPPSSLSLAHSTLNRLTPGARLADVFVQKGLSQAAGHGIGAAIGATAGKLVGAPGIGALIGEHALGPFFSSVLPALAKPILGNPTHPEALKQAITYSLDVARGEQVLAKAAKKLLEAGAEVVPESLMPKEKDLIKLDKYAKSLAENPDSAINAGSAVAHYMPDHTSAVATSVARASSYLNAARPSTEAQGLLNPKRVPSAIEQRAFKRKLELVEQPLLGLKAAKEGTLTPEDMHTLSQVHPELLENMKQRVYQALSKHVADGKSVPYQTRLGLSLFLGEPLDASLQPQHIQVNMLVNASRQAQQQSQQASKPTQKGMNSLSKMSSMSATPNQAREQARAIRK